MTPYKSKKSFKTRLVIAISIVNLAVILTITYLTYRWNAQQLQEQTIAQTQQTIEQAGTNVSTYMDELYRLTLTPYYNDEVLSQLEYSPTNSRDKLNSKRIVEGFLSSVMTLPRSEILRVYIANDDSLYSYTRTPNDMPDLATYAESSWYNESKKNHNLCLLSRTWKECTVKSQPPYFRSFASSEAKTITAKPSAL